MVSVEGMRRVEENSQTTALYRFEQRLKIRCKDYKIIISLNNSANVMVATTTAFIVSLFCHFVVLFKM
jgi:hypothetical protein